jgi:hypothetical protein
VSDFPRARHVFTSEIIGIGLGLKVFPVKAENADEMMDGEKIRPA